MRIKLLATNPIRPICIFGYFEETFVSILGSTRPETQQILFFFSVHYSPKLFLLTHYLEVSNKITVNFTSFQIFLTYIF